MADTQVEENGCHSQLSPELKVRAEIFAQEFESERDIKMHDLQSSLRKTVSDVPTDEGHLLRFLRACQFRITQTLESFKAFYKYKANNPELFAPLTLPEARDIVSRGLIGVLPGRDIQGGRVFFVRIGLWEPYKTDMVHLFRLAISLQLQLIKGAETQIGGIRILVDVEGLSWQHAKFSIPDLRKISKFYLESFPARFDGIHNVGDSPDLNCLNMMVSPFLSSRLKSRTYFHGDDYEQVHQYIALENLPERYGGSVTDEEIEHYTMSLLNEYEGDDFGGTETKLSKMEDKVLQDAVVTASASGSYRRFDPS